MFTGIIEEQGTIASVRQGAKGAVLTIKAKKVLEGTAIGDSIATNGVCLTVTQIHGDTYDVDVMAETMRRSNLGELKAGNHVNLERALRLDSRLGGHIVSGHIDGTGKIKSLKREDNAVWVTIAADKKILRYIVEKGSITIDGISLTVATVSGEDFAVSIIPHTGEETGLLKKNPGDTVNLENDLMAKYVEKLLGLGPAKDNSQKEESQKESRISMDFLAEHGFM